MKKLKISMIAMLAIFAVSCNTDDVEDRPTVTAEEAPVLEAPEEGNVYVLNPDIMDDLAERFVWSAADFGEGIIPQYAVEIDVAGESFDSPVTIGLTDGTTQFAASHGVLNAALLQLDAVPFESANFEVRIKAFVGSEALYSNVVEMIITPYTTETPLLYLRGNFTAASGYGPDWGDNTTPPFISAVEYGSTVFEGYIFMNVAAPEFKMMPGSVDFTDDYGDAAATGMSNTLSQTAEQSNIKAAGPGYYWVKADTELMTYSLTQTNWAVTGSGTPNGWPDNGAVDHDMTYDPVSKTWKIILNLSAGAIKFRANDDWAINYGDDGANGQLELGGADITVASAGSYLIELNLSNPRNYTYVLTPQ